MYRAVGLIFDPPIVGTVLGVLLFVTLRQAQCDKTSQVKIAFQNYLPVFLNFFAIIFLFSRSTYVAIAVVIFLYFVSQRKYIGAFLWIIVLSVSIYLAPKTIPAYFNLESAKIERVSTVLSRKVELENGLRAWITHPIFGIGYNRVAEYKQSLPRVYGKDVSSNHSSSAFHSFWLTQLATTGVVGFALLAGVYILAMKRSMYWALALSIPAIVGLLDNVVFHPFVLTLFILVYFSKVLDTHTLHINS
jgi:O-antigen ligase